MTVAELLASYRAKTEEEARDVARIRALASSEKDPWSRRLPLHVTASAFVVHPDSGRVLLRWHARQQAWLQVGGHGEPGEREPLGVALREGQEETGLTDLVPWPGEALLQVAVVPVPAKGAEPAHEHADLRFVLATGQPDAVRPERPGAELRWLSLPDALAEASEANVREALSRVGQLL
ncbi:8-oxo-dGTP pyrophosphatase MutT (NUDIX family) [Amycolatopsis bartoniae]|uniref:NUDIX hydrolase n=1 Tax=Amycolatopsis bartoniae TaxID=941986 RepID=A0A8H9IPC3_9PSEU|nr:NUDIX domain-containing protein [Amycolatopsis bartoniae]MBB2939591.1 8-oxo-dGTP pyrophosphatase MutT (NUDIX family) [Amycolatopsis bartoniae]TVT07802.1 NUDIX domain-containing protein [Amycolatopsis bartoniae]GHF39448.1 NUDIX hydrolase [Amycolatopsis bartoniae]